MNHDIETNLTGLYLFIFVFTIKQWDLKTPLMTFCFNRKTLPELVWKAIKITLYCFKPNCKVVLIWLPWMKKTTKKHPAGYEMLLAPLLDSFLTQVNYWRLNDLYYSALFCFLALWCWFFNSSAAAAFIFLVCFDLQHLHAPSIQTCPNIDSFFLSMRSVMQSKHYLTYFTTKGLLTFLWYW